MKSTHRSKVTRLKAFFSRTFHLDQPAVLDTPQLPLSSGSCSPVEAQGHDLNIIDPASKIHGSSEHLPIQSRSSALNNGAPGSSPLSLPTQESHNSLLDIGVHNSSLFPHVVNRGRDIGIAGPPTETQNSSPLSSMEPQNHPVTATSLFSGARDFVVNNSQITVQPQGDSITVAQGMKTLSEYVIKGAAYDSSLRDPPPQCHPGTRVHLREKIIAWFRNTGREKALFWLNGPAGVGKSAVIQTVAESLAESDSVGATLFFSRLNDRSDPRRVFTTVAFQLATSIPAYRIYIVERMAVDPSLLEKSMKDQFRIFITQPFGKIGIGKGEGPWAIMLDGLDECDGVDEQSRIVRLVSEFVLTYPKAPLIWAIASRPEPHIVAAFNDEAVTPSHWSEYVPIDSTQACQDVEHYLDASFKSMRKPFPHLHPNWPSETQFLKLTNGALGLFAFANTAVRFMEDPDYADPVSRLNLLIYIIDRVDIKAVDDHPFALLDALYTQILTSIPASVWCTTKRILGFAICVRLGAVNDGLSYVLASSTLMAASLILGLELSVTYGSLHKLHSVLEIPRSKVAHESKVKLLHASFGDYLTDPARSKDFYIDCGECVDDITRSLFQLYLDKPWDTEWERYTPQLSTITGLHFYKNLRGDAENNLHYVITGELQIWRGRGPLKSQEDRLECLDALGRINPVEVCQHDSFQGRTITLLIGLWNSLREDLEKIGLVEEVPLRGLKLDHLDCERNQPTFISKQNHTKWIGNSLNEFQMITGKLQECQLSFPERPAMIYGSSPEKRITVFMGVYRNDQGYFCFPYPF